MIKSLILCIFLVTSVLIESTLISFPFVLTVSIMFYVLYPKIRTLVLIFIASLALDASRVQLIGITPLFIFLILFILNLNERLFDIRDYLYLIALTIFGSIIYSNILGYQINRVLLGMVFGVFILSVSMFVSKKRKAA